MTEQEIVTRTRTFIESAFLQMRPDFALGDRDPLFANGIIDSMGALELAGFLEREFEIVLGPDELTEQNLGTLADIARFVQAKHRDRTRR